MDGRVHSSYAIEDNVSTLQSQSGELTTLQNDFASVQTAIQKLSSSTGNGSLAATLSDNTVAIGGGGCFLRGHAGNV